VSSTSAKIFRAAHGDPVNWSDVDFEVHQNLALVDQAARRERWRRPLRRAASVLLVAYALPLYVLADVIYAARHAAWAPLENRLDQVDDQLSALEDAGIRAGDQRFVERLGAATDRLGVVVSRLTTRS
jgi:hypothetical protein